MQVKSKAGSIFSGHSRTGHTGHTARLASKLARLANRLPGTNVPGWNFGWPTPKFPDARPHTAHFSSISPASYFPAVFTCVQPTGSVDLLSRRPLGYATWVESLQLIWPFELGRAWNLLACSECDPLQLCFGARRRFLHATSLMPWSLARGCSQTGKVERSPARCSRKTSLWRSGTGFGRWGNWLFSVFGVLFQFSFSDACVSRLCAAAGSFSHPLFTQCWLSSK